MTKKCVFDAFLFCYQGVDYLKYDNCFNLGIDPKKRLHLLFISITQRIIISLFQFIGFGTIISDILQCVML